MFVGKNQWLPGDQFPSKSPEKKVVNRSPWGFLWKQRTGRSVVVREERAGALKPRRSELDPPCLISGWLRESIPLSLSYLICKMALWASKETMGKGSTTALAQSRYFTHARTKFLSCATVGHSQTRQKSDPSFPFLKINPGCPGHCLIVHGQCSRRKKRGRLQKVPSLLIFS